MIRILSATMAVLFAVATVVQLNDPDAIRWMILYAAACALSVRAAARGSVPVAIAAALAFVALTWGLWLGSGVYGGVALPELFGAWEMKDARVELARETGGLLLTGVWLLFLAAHSRYARAR